MATARILALEVEMHVDTEYYRKRLDQEIQLAKAETDMSVRHVHETLAQMYQVRLRAEEPGRSNLARPPMRNG